MLMIKSERPVKYLYLRDLSVKWVEAQRPLRAKRVQQIADNFNPDKFGIPTVAEIQNGDGSTEYHVIDGQHRIEGAKLYLGDSQRVPAEVIVGCKTPADAAKIWAGRNCDQMPPTSLERFLVLVTAEDPETTAINGIIETSGFVVSKHAENGLAAVGSATRVYRSMGADALRWVLKTLRATWGLRSDAVAASLITGFGEFYHRFHDEADATRIARNVSRRYTPSQMLGAARSGKDIMRGSMAQAVMRLIVNAYNYRLHDENKLTLSNGS